MKLRHWADQTYGLKLIPYSKYYEVFCVHACVLNGLMSMCLHYHSYRLATDDGGCGGGSSAASSSKSSSTPTVASVPGEQPSTSRRLAWGGSGGSLRKRAGPTKTASFSGSNVGSVRMTRSSSKEKVPSGEIAKDKDKGRGQECQGLLSVNVERFTNVLCTNALCTNALCTVHFAPMQCTSPPYTELLRSV